jgi:hypothetical protein
MGTVSSILASHVELRLRCVDRVGVAGYIPDLAYEGGLVKFMLHRASLVGKANIPSPALLGKNHDRMVADFEHFIQESGLSVVRFRAGESKELIARPYQLAAATEDCPGVVLIGKAQERVKAWAGFKDSNALASAGHPHFSFTRQSRIPDNWYFYLWDNDWGPAFIKLCSYAPYPLWIMANGHEWTKRQLAHQGVEFSELDNGLWRVGDPEAARHICASLGAGHLRSLIDRWLPTLPSPLIPADKRAGFSWSFSLRQLELSDTAVFDQPRAGRAWFEAAIRDHLDLGRPDNVSLVFDRRIVTRGKRPTPGRFATEIITKGTQPQIQVRYRSSKTKAYFKEQRALRVETTINNAVDVGLKKTLNAENWRALRRTGDQINARFLEVLGEGQSDLPDDGTLEAVVLPSVHDGQRAPGLRFGDPRIVGLFGALCSFGHIWNGLTNPTLRSHMQELFDPSYSTQRATYDLRRLRLKGFIERIPGTHRYTVTPYGRRMATFFTRLTTRVVVPALSELDALTRPTRREPAPVAAAWRAYDKEVRSLLRNSGLAA